MNIQISVLKNFNISRKKITGLKYLFLSLPFVFLVIAFNYMLLFGWAYAFVDYKIGFRLSDMKFVGFDNFIKLFDGRNEILRVLRNTFAMSTLGIIFSPLTVIFAIMLNEIGSSKFKRFVQTMTTLPNFISWIVVFGLSFAMFSSSGLVNTVLSVFHIPTSEVGILGNNTYVWLFQLGLGLWKGLGWSAIIFIAVIAGIDVELYDAAKAEGANRVQTIMHVTVPGLIPTYLVLLLLGISNFLNNGFDQYFVFYNSMVADKIEVLDYYVYKVGILINDYSYSIAIGMLKSMVSVILLFTVNWISKRLRGESLV
ncbi:MAG: sugar ABC transporter permease [Ruminiclostridium sp.]|nr:sugar ABC transporter permease [Ruminiclostridium sp.]